MNKYHFAPNNAKPNPLLCADSYKVSHFNQYPEGTEHIYSYIEPRKGSNPVVILGIHDFCELLNDTLQAWNINELQEIAEEHGVPFNEYGWWKLLDKYHGKGFPLRIMGVPEGTTVDPGTPVAVIVNTDPEFPWLTSFFETVFLRMVWYPSSVASNSRAIKVRLKEFMERTGSDMASLPFKLHDFGSRGATCGEAAGRGGAGHLTQFQGTDTLEAIKYIRDNYGCQMAGFSIPATEHSTVTSWGREAEIEMYEKYIRTNLGPSKVAACVSDSYNIWEALKMWKTLEPVLLEVGGTLVVRPDSGDPITTPVRVIEELMQLFGYTTNDKGFKVLPDHVRVIQGDGIDMYKLVRICGILVDKKISIDNIAFGMGGGLLQKVDRDTYGFAMKCSAACVKGKWRDVWKDPIGGGKTSKKGLVRRGGVIPYEDDCYVLEDVSYTSAWRPYYTNGKTTPRDSWETIVSRCTVET